MPLVAGEHEGERANRHFVLVGGASAAPGLAIQTRKQRNRRASDVFEFVNQILQAASAERTAANVIVLLEACERRLVSARKPERTIGEYPFAIDDVTDYFF